MIAGTSASWYCIPRRCRISSAKNAEPIGAPNSTANAAAIPAIVEAPGLDRRSIGARRASQPASVPHVVTSGASGPAAPPAEIVSDRHRDERAQRANARRRRPTRGCCRRAARRRPGCPSTRAISTTTTPTPPSTANSAAPRRSAAAPSTCWSRWIASRYAGADRAAADPDEQRRAEQRGRQPEREALEPRRSSISAKHIVVRYTCAVDAAPADDLSDARVPASCSRSAPRCGGSCTGARSRRPPLGITPAQHQLLLAIRGHDGPARPDDRRRRRRPPAPPPQRGRARRPRGGRRARRAALRPGGSAGRSPTIDRARSAPAASARRFASRRAAPDDAGRGPGAVRRRG